MHTGFQSVAQRNATTISSPLLQFISAEPTVAAEDLQTSVMFVNKALRFSVSQYSGVHSGLMGEVRDPAHV